MKYKKHTTRIKTSFLGAAVLDEGGKVKLTFVGFCVLCRIGFIYSFSLVGGWVELKKEESKKGKSGDYENVLFGNVEGGGVCLLHSFSSSL